MASRPPNGAGPKNLRTYGLSRNRTSSPSALRQSIAPSQPSPPKRSRSRLFNGQSAETTRRETSSQAESFDSDPFDRHMDNQTVGKKRKCPSSTMLEEKSDFDQHGGFNDQGSNLCATASQDPGRLHSLAQSHQISTTNRTGTLHQANTISLKDVGTDNAHKSPSSTRRRLIDVLATAKSFGLEQAVDSASSGIVGVPDHEPGLNLGRQIPNPPDIRSGAGNRRSTPTSRKIKLTYSQSGSSLSESRVPEKSSPVGMVAVNDIALTETQALSPAAADSAIYDSVPDDTGPQPAIRSVHELRRSGAINRFADEMDDLLVRIGKPTTGSLATRRTALCELAQQLPKDCFAEQFRDHTCRDKVAKGIGEDEDVVCGFALAAALVIFLKSNPAPHLVRQLAQQGLGKLLGRLLRLDDDIDEIAARRRTQLSRSLAASLHDMKRILMQMPIWHGLQPRHISPRTLSLRLLETVARCLEGQLLQQVADEIGQDLATVAAAVGASKVVDHALTVCALEVMSNAGITMGSNSEASRLQLPRSICIFLRGTLENWPCERHELDSAVLKLAINITNTESGAAAFDGTDLCLLANRIGRGFRTVQEAIGCGFLENDMYDELLLTLGVMINVVEHSAQARSSVDDKTLDELANLWQDNQPSGSECSQADPVNKSKLSVALNYLAVLLGYLCLTTKGRNRMKLRIGSLVTSIRGFVDMYKAVDSITRELIKMLGYES
ncbi:hypothetical protein XA68_10677 [Ophiocordyceps unilateralis]|uniref:Wings apart-like protein C-terminal domain-containing protein n=1 Tax=Ophiocordyceps unilateralis TaxID=268505 RepID=A0A2A9P192_OPHUN|nr:hypothetical protein XA68_10677 [Ophiocordyceps unilateralis]